MRHEYHIVDINIASVYHTTINHYITQPFHTMLIDLNTTK